MANWTTPAAFQSGWTAPQINFSNYNGYMNGGFNNNFAPNFWGGYIGGGASTGKTKSEDNFEKRKELNAAKIAKQNELNAIKEQQADFNGTKRADGTAEIKEDIKKMGFWDKLKRGAMNVISGVDTVAKSIVGFDKDGKWNPVKCLTNIGIAVAAGVAITCAPAFVGAVFGACGASAATVTTATTVTGMVLKYAPAIAGLIGGTIYAGHSTYVACTTDNIDEFDQATQGVGQGLMIAGASAFSLRGTSAAGGTLSEGAKSFAGKFWNGCKNIFSNPIKAIQAESTAMSSSINNTVSAAAANGTKAGLGQLYGAANNASKNFFAGVKMDKFNNELTRTKTDLRNSITKLEEQISATNDAKTIAKLNYEKDLYSSYLSKIEGATKKGEWKSLTEFAKESGKLTNKNWYKFNGNKVVKINGQEFKKADLSELNSSIQNMNGNIKNLSNLKFDTMASVAGSSNYSQLVDDFGFSNKWYAKPANFVSAKMNKGVSKMEVVGTAACLSAPWLLLQPVCNTQYLAFNNIGAMFAPSYEKMQGQIATVEQVQQQEAQFNQVIGQYNNDIKRINEELRALA